MILLDLLIDLCVQALLKEQKDEEKYTRDRESPGAVIIPSKTCSEVWRTLVEYRMIPGGSYPEDDMSFEDIVRRKAGEGAWKDIIRRLKELRQIAFEAKSQEFVERFEEAAKILRQIKEAKQTTLLFLGNDLRPAQQEIVRLRRSLFLCPDAYFPLCFCRVIPRDFSVD